MIAVTDDDNTNILASQVAHSYNPKCKKIVRISDVSYLSNEHILSKVDFKIDHIINSEEILVQDLKKLLTFPGSTSLSFFLNQKVTLGGFKIKSNSPLFEKKIKDLDLPEETQVIAYASDGHFKIPDTQQTLQEYSILYLAFPSKLSHEIQKMFYPQKTKIKSLVIFENGKKDTTKSYYLTETLSKELKIDDIRIIEESAQKAQELSKISSNTILNGPISKPSFWTNQELNEADAFLGLSENNEKNILAGLIGNQLRVPFNYALADLPEYTTLTSSTPLISILSPSVLSINQILKHTHQHEIINMAILNYLDLEATEFEVLEESKMINQPIKKINKKKDVLVSHLLRNDKLIEITADIELKLGDKILIITKIENLKFLSNLFKSK